VGVQYSIEYNSLAYNALPASTGFLPAKHPFYD